MTKYTLTRYAPPGAFKRMRLSPPMGRLIFLWMILLLQVNVTHVHAQENTYVLLIGGLGGSEDYTLKFQDYLSQTRSAFINKFQVPAANVTVLAENSIASESFVDNVSTAENISAHFEWLKAKAGPSDNVFVILFGHGGFENGEARLNIPRRDLNQHDYASLVGKLSAGRLVFINTGSASAPYVEAISGAGRVVITATRTGTQKNETSFPRFMVEAFTSPGADLDKDGRLSVAEVFSFATEKTDQMFVDNANIPTENALLDDNGDQKGSRLEELETGVDGNLANITYFSMESLMVAGVSGSNATLDPGWLQEKGQIEVDIAELKSQKSSLDPEEYYTKLEVLFVRLARGNALAERGQ